MGTLENFALPGEAPAWPRVGPHVRGCVMPVICRPVLGQPPARVARRMDRDDDDSVTAYCAFRGESEVVFFIFVYHYPCYLLVVTCCCCLCIHSSQGCRAPRLHVQPSPTCQPRAEKPKTLFFQMLCLMLGEGEGGLLNWLPLCPLRPRCLLLETRFSVPVHTLLVLCPPLGP